MIWKKVRTDRCALSETDKPGVVSVTVYESDNGKYTIETIKTNVRRADGSGWWQKSVYKLLKDDEPINEFDLLCLAKAYAQQLEGAHG